MHSAQQKKSEIARKKNENINHNNKRERASESNRKNKTTKKERVGLNFAGGGGENLRKNNTDRREKRKRRDGKVGAAFIDIFIFIFDLFKKERKHYRSIFSKSTIDYCYNYIFN